MTLQPRSFFYKKKQKKRSCFSFNSSKISLNFGSCGLTILNPVQLTSIQISRFKLFLKRSSRKSDYTRRFVWFSAFPHIPLTRKPNGTRMGKGKGKLECWFTHVSGGTTLFEFKNLRKGRAAHFMRQMTHKLGTYTKHTYVTSSVYVNQPISTSRKIFFKTFW